MACVDWMLNVKKIVVCSCDYGCPCEFMAPPTKGYCEGLEAHEILVDYEKRFAYLTVAAYGPYSVISKKSYGA